MMEMFFLNYYFERVLVYDTHIWCILCVCIYLYVCIWCFLQSVHIPQIIFRSNVYCVCNTLYIYVYNSIHKFMNTIRQNTCIDGHIWTAYTMFLQNTTSMIFCEWMIGIVLQYVKKKKKTYQLKTNKQRKDLNRTQQPFSHSLRSNEPFTIPTQKFKLVFKYSLVFL